MQYTNYAMKNNIFGTLSAPVGSLATTIQLNTGQGARFTTDMLATLESVEGNKVTKREIVKITNISGDTLTVIRKFAPCPSSDDANTQGQVSYSFSADDTISVYIAKEHFDKIDSSINDLYDNGVNKLRTEVVSGLQISVGAGPVLVGSAYYDFAGDTITLTDNATNYVEIDKDGYLVANTSAWGNKNTKIALVTTSGGAITSIVDRRLGTVGGEIGGVNIHDLTEKSTINQNDEYIMADSDNIYNNKKIKYSTLTNKSFLNSKTSFTSNSNILSIGDSQNSYLNYKMTIEDFLSCLQPVLWQSKTGGSAIVYSRYVDSGPYSVRVISTTLQRVYRTICRQVGTQTTLSNALGTYNTARGTLIYNNEIYICGFKTNTGYVVNKIGVEDDMSGTWTNVITVDYTMANTAQLLGFDGTYFVFKLDDGTLYYYDTNGSLVGTHSLGATFSEGFITATGRVVLFNSATNQKYIYVYDNILTMNLLKTFSFSDNANIIAIVGYGNVIYTYGYYYATGTSSEYDKLGVPFAFIP